MKSGSLLELEAAIRDEEPESPSVVVGQVVSEILSDGTTRTKCTPESVSGTREGRPERLRARLCGDLDKIVLKALRKDARERYLSAEQLSEDIGRHLMGGAVIAQKTTLIYRWGKFIRRHKLGLAVAAVFVLTLVGGVIATTRQAQVARGHARKNRWLLYAAQTFRRTDGGWPRGAKTGRRRFGTRRRTGSCSRSPATSSGSTGSRSRPTAGC